MPGRLRARFSRSDQLTERPDFALVGVLRVPEEQTSPGIAIARRIGYAFAALLFAVVVVYLDRDGYRDAQGNALSLLDCLYYATVSLSTTGYGDITPLTPEARLINVLVITPLRVPAVSATCPMTNTRQRCSTGWPPFMGGTWSRSAC